MPTQIDPHSPGDVRHNLYFFFRILKDEGIISSVSQTLGKRLAGQLNEIHPKDGGSAWAATSFRNFNVSTVDACKVGVTTCSAIKSVLPRIEFPAGHANKVAEIYMSCFNEKLDHQPDPDYPYFRSEEHVERRNSQGDIALAGDYLLFRSERRRVAGQGTTKVFAPSVSISFLRFFSHRVSGTRFMLLPTAPFVAKSSNPYLGARGWVNSLGESFLATGQIIDRGGDTIEDEVIHGGTSTLVFDANRNSRYVRRDLDSEARMTIDATSVISLRAAYGQEPSISRGYIVRAHGAEALGGLEEQTPAVRFHEIKSLQRRLSHAFPIELDLQNCASVLAKATGLPAKAFFNEKSQSYHGLVVNYPFATGSDPVPPPYPLFLPTPNSVAPSWEDVVPEQKGKGQCEGIDISHI